MSGAPLVETRWSAALVDAGVDVRDAHLRLDVVDPVVVADIGLRRSFETEDRGGQPLAMMVANPNFFISMPSSLLCSSRGALLAVRTLCRPISNSFVPI